MKDLIISVGAYLAILGTFITLVKNIIELIKLFKNGSKNN